MSWANPFPMATGLSGDVLMEHLINAGSDVTLSSNLIQFPTGTNNKKCLVLLRSGSSCIGNNAIGAVSGKIAISGTPSSEINLLSDGTQATTHAPFRVGTDGKLKFYDDAGNLLLSGSSTVSTNSAAPTEFIAFWDFLTLSSGFGWLSLVVGGVEEVACNIGKTYASFNASGTNYAYFGHYTPAGSNCGATMTGSMIIARLTLTAADAPHLTPYPRLLGTAPNPPTSEGDSHAWTNGTTASPNTYQDVDESPNDGGTTAIKDIQTTDPKTAHDHLFHYSAANPLGGTETIDFVQSKHVGTLNGSGKNYAQSLIKLAGSAAAANLVVSPGLTSYVGCAAIHNNTPAGGSWAVTDFDLSAGVSNLQWGARSLVAAGTDTGADITMFWSPQAVYHTATVTTSTPTVVNPRRQYFAMTKPRPKRAGWHLVSIAPPASATPVTPSRRRWVWVS